MERGKTFMANPGRWAVLALGAALGCSTAQEPALPLDGDWSYEVDDLTYANGMACTLDFRLTIEQRARDLSHDVFTGFAEHGTLSCAGTDTIPGGTTSLATHTINDGLFNPRVGTLLFDISTDLHHQGALEGDTVDGTVRHDDTLGWGEGVGTFVMTRDPP